MLNSFFMPVRSAVVKPVPRLHSAAARRCEHRGGPARNIELALHPSCCQNCALRETCGTPAHNVSRKAGTRPQRARRCRRCGCEHVQHPAQTKSTTCTSCCLRCVQIFVPPARCTARTPRSGGHNRHCCQTLCQCTAVTLLHNRPAPGQGAAHNPTPTCNHPARSRAWQHASCASLQGGAPDIRRRSCCRCCTHCHCHCRCCWGTHRRQQPNLFHSTPCQNGACHLQPLIPPPHPMHHNAHTRQAQQPTVACAAPPK